MEDKTELKQAGAQNEKPQKPGIFFISDAAKQIAVESHVLRYWEEELELPVKRNKLGHRYYTAEDVKRLKRIKEMKEEGFQLKAIRRALKQEMQADTGQQGEAAVGAGLALNRKQEDVPAASFSEREEKSYRLQLLLKNMMLEAIREGNQEFCGEIKESILKELDYQFRMQEERDEQKENERLKREEEHYKKIDEMLREKAEKKDKRKKRSFF